MKKNLLAWFSSLLLVSIAAAQITQIEQKETRATLGTQNRGYGPYDWYKFSGATNSLTIDAGKKLQILDFYYRVGHTCIIYLDVKFPNSSEKFRIFNSNLTNGSVVPTASPVGKTFIGPVTVELILIPAQEEYATSVGNNIEGNTTFNIATALWRYEIDDYGVNSSSGGSNFISATSVVVPANATGDVDVLLEQSTDMITWTQCLPGTYNSSTVKRFFRLRAVEK